MKYLRPEQVLFIQARIISETGGSYGLRDIGLLQAALERPKSTFDDNELYPGIFEKTAALIQSLVNNHPFIDGNKRTGVLAALLFLRINDIEIKAKNDDLVRLLQDIVHGLTIPDIARWFEARSD